MQASVINHDQIIEEATKRRDYHENSKEDKRALKIQTAEEWLQDALQEPPLKQLCGDLWHQGEISICFADTGVGKTIFSVQITDSIARGEAIRGIPTELIPQKALYIDFEMSRLQFLTRYSKDGQSLYGFNGNFLRSELNPDNLDYQEAGFQDMTSFLYAEIEHGIVNSGAKVVIVDNITYLRDETEKAKEALPLMKHLKALKSKYDLSILVLAHTPKRDPYKPLTRNDLAGSKMLINFCDSAFAIGESSKDKNVRYVKQIKARNTEIKYGVDNVLLFEVCKPDNFLKFDFIGFDDERNHLKQSGEMDEQQRNDMILDYHKQGLSVRDIERNLGIGKSTVSRVLKELGVR